MCECSFRFSFRHKLSFDKAFFLLPFFYLFQVDFSFMTMADGGWKERAQIKKLANFQRERERRGNGKETRWAEVAKKQRQKGEKKVEYLMLFHKYLHDCDIQKPNVKMWLMKNSCFYANIIIYLTIWLRLPPFLSFFLSPTHSLRAAFCLLPLEVKISIIRLEV